MHFRWGGSFVIVHSTFPQVHIYQSCDEISNIVLLASHFNWQNLFTLLYVSTRSQAVARIADLTTPLGVTWPSYRHRSRDHLIAHMPFSIGSSLERSLCLQPFSWYCALSVLGSRVWPFGPRDVTDHVTIWKAIRHFSLIVLWNQASVSLTVSEIFNVECSAMVDMTLIWPLNKGQGHSFWYQSISHIRLPIGCQ